MGDAFAFNTYIAALRKFYLNRGSLCSLGYGYICYYDYVVVIVFPSIISYRGIAAMLSLFCNGIFLYLFITLFLSAASSLSSFKSAT